MTQNRLFVYLLLYNGFGKLYIFIDEIKTKEKSTFVGKDLLVKMVKQNKIRVPDLPSLHNKKREGRRQKRILHKIYYEILCTLYRNTTTCLSLQVRFFDLLSICCSKTINILRLMIFRDDSYLHH